MQSSPPTRAWERPASPTESQYTLDLAALDGDSRSGASSPALPAQQVDHVHSEDIDGPSDFTQNLERWMRGGTLNSKYSTGQSGLASVKERKEQDESTRGSLMPAWQSGGEEDEHSASHHTPTNSPPKESVFASSRQDGVTGSCEGDPYAEAATPQPPPHQQQLLQPTVEDYYSEFTPAHRSTSQHPSQNQYRQRQHSQSQYSTPGRPSSETISPVRSPVRSPERSPARSPSRSTVLRAPENFSSQADEHNLERQMQELREKCQQLEALNSALNSAVDEERRRRGEEHETYQAQLAEASRRNKDGFQHQISEMKTQLQKHDQEITRTKQAHAAETRRLKQDLEREQTDHIQELRDLEQDLELARRSRDDAEESARVAKEDLIEYRAEREASQGLKQRSSSQEQGLRSQLADLQELMRITTEENGHLKSAKHGAVDMADSIRAELTLLRQTHSEETARLMGDHRRAVSMAEDLQRQLKESREHSRSQEGALPESVEPLSTPANAEEVQRLRDELESKQTSLNEVMLDRDALQDELTTTKSELDSTKLDLDALNTALKAMQTEREALKSDLDEKDDINKEIDSKLQKAMKRREMHYKKLLEEKEKERKVMVKALFQMWGREECGIADESRGEKQRYRYMYKKRGEATEGGGMTHGG
ncbi:hypothetical protein LTR09_007721 [Extremus antarcticus]|uniref:Uncharacterized protein n=1 Tax=Extremus antarcticus TaxID=702011 RepID=A0AAJ0GCR2_9PEZI|nr:hypothetical protein LTR09_007721 [Extremus antarcticus]